MNLFTDTHCHLYFPELRQGIESEIDKALGNGVTKILVPSIDLATLFDSLAISTDYPGVVYPAAGIHPNYAGYIHPHELEIIDLLIEENHLSAIGEIGLDFYRDYFPKSIQIKIFEQMLNFASKYLLPICLHNRAAEKQIIRILTNWMTELNQAKSNLKNFPGVFHAYDGSELIAEFALNNNFMLGIGGMVTYKKATKLRSMVKKLPLDSFLLETDAPFLSPHPFRGKKNHPGNIPLIAEEISNLKNIPIEEVMHVTSKNANELFRWVGEK